MKRIQFTNDELRMIEAAIRMANAMYDTFLDGWSDKKCIEIHDSVTTKLDLMLEQRTKMY